MVKTLNVVVGLVFNPQNQSEVLIALRPAHVVQPGVWEFPGGKIEPNETAEEALIREFHEEIGIEITSAEFFLRVEKHFPEKNLLLILHTYCVVSFAGQAYGRENQEIRWVPINTLQNYVFPEANADIVKRLIEITQ